MQELEVSEFEDWTRPASYLWLIEGEGGPACTEGAYERDVEAGAFSQAYGDEENQVHGGEGQPEDYSNDSLCST